MPRFIHMAPEPLASRIERNGIQPTRTRGWPDGSSLAGIDRAVWAFPMTPSFTVSHQWLRELKRFGVRTLVAIDFRVADNEPVYAHHYSHAPERMTAAAAVGLILSQPDPLGWEVMIPRRIRPAEIVGVRHVPQKLGWRTIPDRNKALICDCPQCVSPGTVKSTRRRAQFAAYVEGRRRGQPRPRT